MTDNEIIKALECCSINGCKNCKYKGKAPDCMTVLQKDTIDLINRQKAEIGRLQVLVDEMSGYFPSCINCEGKTTLGERTDKCVYVFDDYDFDYCTRRGLDNIF